MDGEDLSIITLKSLSSSFGNFIETLNITSNIDLTFEQLSNNILQKDRWRKQSRNSNGLDTSKVVLAAKFKGKSKGSEAEGGQKDSSKPNDSSKYEN